MTKIIMYAGKIGKGRGKATQGWIKRESPLKGERGPSGSFISLEEKTTNL